MSGLFQPGTSPYTTALFGGNDTEGKSDREANRLVAFQSGTHAKIHYLRGAINNETDTLDTATWATHEDKD